MSPFDFEMETNWDVFYFLHCRSPRPCSCILLMVLSHPKFYWTSTLIIYINMLQLFQSSTPIVEVKKSYESGLSMVGHALLFFLSWDKITLFFCFYP